MRSQVQVLAGPPTNPAGQSAAGSEPGALAAGLGRAGAAHTRRLDTARVDSRRPTTGRVDSSRPTAGPLDDHPKVTRHRTAGPRTPKPDGWTPHAGHRRPTPWLACWPFDHGDHARPLDTGWTLLQADVVWASNNQDRSAATTPRAPTLLRMGLATAATVSCRWYAAVQLAPWRTAVLG
jgi:hypothetical protein